MEPRSSPSLEVETTDKFSPNLEVETIWWNRGLVSVRKSKPPRSSPNLEVEPIWWNRGLVSVWKLKPPRSSLSWTWKTVQVHDEIYMKFGWFTVASARLVKAPQIPFKKALFACGSWRPMKAMRGRVMSSPVGGRRRARLTRATTAAATARTATTDPRTTGVARSGWLRCPRLRPRIRRFPHRSRIRALFVCMIGAGVRRDFPGDRRAVSGSANAPIIPALPARVAFLLPAMSHVSV